MEERERKGNRAMTCLAVAEPASSPSSRLPAPNRWELIRASVFWSTILLVIVSPAVLSAVILLRS